jgi:hypothetical protein
VRWNKKMRFMMTDEDDGDNSIYSVFDRVLKSWLLISFTVIVTSRLIVGETRIGQHERWHEDCFVDLKRLFQERRRIDKETNLFADDGS